MRLTSAMEPRGRSQDRRCNLVCNGDAREMQSVEMNNRLRLSDRRITRRRGILGALSRKRRRHYFGENGCFAVSFFEVISSIFGSFFIARAMASLVAS